jgi:non-specific serine/threonine protein kinase
VAAYSVECERRTRQALGNAALEAIIEENGALTVAQAISLALDQSVAVGAPAPVPVPVPAPAAAAAPPTSPLTRREQEIAVLIARGMTNRTIASVLVLSPRTIDGHVGRIFAKLGFVSRAQVAAWVSERKAASGR